MVNLRVKRNEKLIIKGVIQNNFKLTLAQRVIKFSILCKLLFLLLSFKHKCVHFYEHTYACNLAFKKG